MQRKLQALGIKYCDDANVSDEQIFEAVRVCISEMPIFVYTMCGLKRKHSSAVRSAHRPNAIR